MTDAYRAFLGSWATEIESRSDRVRSLIGDRHWGSDGNHKEFLIREFLTRYLPSPIRVGHGFVRSHSPDGNCSPEIDVLVTNPSKYPLFFDEGGLQIAPVMSVRAAIEVKTTFGASQLTQALQRIGRIRHLIHSEHARSDVWLGAIFYRSDRTVSATSVLDTIEECYRKIAQSGGRVTSFPQSELYEEVVSAPTCLCLSGEFVAFFRKVPDGSNSTQVDIFEAKSLSFALAAIDLISSVSEANEPTALELASGNFGLSRAGTRTIQIEGNA